MSNSDSPPKSKLPSEELKRKIERMQPKANEREQELIRKLRHVTVGDSGRPRKARRSKKGFWRRLLGLVGL